MPSCCVDIILQMNHVVTLVSSCLKIGSPDKVCCGLQPLGLLWSYGLLAQAKTLIRYQFDKSIACFIFIENVYLVYIGILILVYLQFMGLSCQNGLFRIAVQVDISVFTYINSKKTYVITYNSNDSHNINQNKQLCFKIFQRMECDFI